MLKLLLGILGLVELLYPERFVRVLTKYSYDYEGEAPVAKPWVVSAARIEGFVILGAVVYSTLKKDCRCTMLCGASDDEDTEALDSASVDRVG